jgi:hypothetical protein
MGFTWLANSWYRSKLLSLLTTCRYHPPNLIPTPSLHAPSLETIQDWSIFLKQIFTRYVELSVHRYGDPFHHTFRTLITTLHFGNVTMHLQSTDFHEFHRDCSYLVQTGNHPRYCSLTQILSARGFCEPAGVPAVTLPLLAITSFLQRKALSTTEHVTAHSTQTSRPVFLHPSNALSVFDLPTADILALSHHLDGSLQRIELRLARVHVLL